MRIWTGAALVLGSILIAGCGSEDRDREDYGDITQGTGGIGLSDRAEHRGGYQRSQCLLCHNIALNVHRSPVSTVNVTALNSRIRDAADPEAVCLECHGANGLPGED